MKLKNALIQPSTEGEKACLNVVHKYVIEKIGSKLAYGNDIELNLEDIKGYLLSDEEYIKEISMSQNNNGEKNATGHMRKLAEKGFWVYDKDRQKLLLNELFKDYFFLRNSKQ